MSGLMVQLTPAELDAVIFAVRSDLEIVENDIVEFEGEDETLRDALDKLVNAYVCSRPDCMNRATETWDDQPYCLMHLMIIERMEE